MTLRFRCGATGGIGGGPPISGLGGAVNLCKVGGGDDADVPCTKSARPNSFKPEVQWTWTAPKTGNYSGSVITPLVGNFTDDNKDGAIDLCDTPDVLVVTTDGSMGGGNGTLHLLAGDTGAHEMQFASPVSPFQVPAFGDIDGDGLPEVVTATAAVHENTKCLSRPS